MILPDTNLLVYAYNRDDPRHPAARAWLEGSLAGAETVAVTWATVGGFVRLCTSRRAMPRPVSIGEAIEIVDSWFEHSTVRLIRPGEGHWTILKSMLKAVRAAGNLVSDAHLAALAIEHDCELCSADTDFGRFPGLRWSNPLSPSKG